MNGRSLFLKSPDFISVSCATIAKMDKMTNKRVHKKLVSMQPGDVPVTYADTLAQERDISFKPSTPLRQGLRRFTEWHKDYYTDGSR